MCWETGTGWPSLCFSDFQGPFSGAVILLGSEEEDAVQGKIVLPCEEVTVHGGNRTQVDRFGELCGTQPSSGSKSPRGFLSGAGDLLV